MGKKIVLIVDDEATSREILRLMIEGFCAVSKYNIPEIIETADGLNAWRLLTEEKISPDIIFTDFQMPRMSGIQLIDKIDHELNLKAKIVVCSGFYPIRDEVERRGRYFFQKPFRNNDLYEIIKKGAIISCFA